MCDNSDPGNTRANFRGCLQSATFLFAPSEQNRGLVGARVSLQKFGQFWRSDSKPAVRHLEFDCQDRIAIGPIGPPRPRCPQQQSDDEYAHHHPQFWAGFGDAHLFVLRQPWTSGLIAPIRPRTERQLTCNLALSSPVSYRRGPLDHQQGVQLIRNIAPTCRQSNASLD